MAQILLTFSVRTIVAVLAASAAIAQIARQSDHKLTPQGLLETNTLLTIYGRAFGVAPIPGRLGTYHGFDELAADMSGRVQAIGAVNGGKKVMMAIHLVDAMAIPCKPSGDCLDYCDAGLVGKYIQPAAERGWAVILDSQVGRSSPLEQVRRMIERGYLKYDNVHVALDPEFHVCAGHDDPGVPVGTVDASQINQVQSLLNSYVEEQNLQTKKVLIVHQFGDPTIHDGVPYMIRNKKQLQDFPNVELVIDMDGLGSPAVKVHKYNLLTDSRIYPFIEFRGIKIFYKDPGETQGHFDRPPMTVDEIFGIKAVSGGWRVMTRPDVVIIA